MSSYGVHRFVSSQSWSVKALMSLISSPLPAAASSVSTLAPCSRSFIVPPRSIILLPLRSRVSLGLLGLQPLDCLGEGSSAKRPPSFLHLPGLEILPALSPGNLGEQRPQFPRLYLLSPVSQPIAQLKPNS